MLTAAQLRGAAWVRLRHDVYADARLERNHGLACRAVALSLPAGAAVAGPPAAVLHGVPAAASAADPVHVVTPPAVRMSPRRGVVAHVSRLSTGDVARLGDLPVTSPARTAWDVASWLTAVSAVPIVDGLLGRGLVTPAVLRRLVDARRGERGWRRAAEVFGLADGRAQSFPESQLRVRLVSAGLPAPVPQFPVALPGMTLHPDLAWPEFKVAVEYDGVWHASADQLHRDRRRLNRLVAAGWIVLHVTSRRLHGDLPALLREIRAALTSRGWHPTRARSGFGPS